MHGITDLGLAGSNGRLARDRGRRVTELHLSGHEWAKGQLEKAGIGYEALDNGFRTCENPAALQKICDRLGPGALKRLRGTYHLRPICVLAWKRAETPDQKAVFSRKLLISQEPGIYS